MSKITVAEENHMKILNLLRTSNEKYLFQLIRSRNLLLTEVNDSIRLSCSELFSLHFINAKKIAMWIEKNVSMNEESFISIGEYTFNVNMLRGGMRSCHAA